MPAQLNISNVRLVTNLMGKNFMKRLLLLTLLCSQSLFASQLSDLSFLYYKDQAQNIAHDKSLENPGQCNPQSMSCLRATCSRLSPSNCDDDYEIKKIIEMCKGGVSGDCVFNSTRRMRPSNVDDIYEMQKIINECKSNIGGSCIDIYITRLSEINVDDDYEVTKYLKKCSGISNDVADCASFTCSKLSAISCDDDYEIDRIIKTCSNL